MFCSFLLRLRELNTDGTLKDVIGVLGVEFGITIGSHVERKGEKVKGRVLVIDKDNVRIELVGSSVVQLFPTHTFLSGQFTVFTPKPDPTHIVYDALSTIGDLSARRKCAQIFVRVMELALEHDKPSSVKLQVKPHRQVIALNKFDKGKLTFVPVCSKVLHKDGDAPAASCVSVQVSGCDGFHFWLSPFNVDPSSNPVAPFWHIAHSDEGCNMEIHWVKFDDIKVKVPVARNTKSIVEGDYLILPKAKSAQIDSADSKHSKKKKTDPDPADSEPNKKAKAHKSK